MSLDAIIDGMFQGMEQSLNLIRENQQLKADKAELQAENERLRERVRELAKRLLWDEIYGTMTAGERRKDSAEVWEECDHLHSLAEESGVWFDDDGNEVPLAEWKARGRPA